MLLIGDCAMLGLQLQVSAHLESFMELEMTEQILPPHSFADVEHDFSVGHVFNQTFSIFSRNLLPFSLVSMVAYLPNALIQATRAGVVVQGGARLGLMLILAGLVATVFGAIAQAAVLYAAFADMRGRPVDLLASFRIGLSRFFPVLGATICFVVLYGLAFVALIVPGLMVLTMLFVTIPACVVEKLGPIKSLARSARLTKGHRWKIFGLAFATIVVGLILQSVLGGLGRAIGGAIFGTVVVLLWSGAFGAFNAILGVVTYHDLRVAKEGVSTDQIAAVFD